ncbi:hypothetical protein [Jatrophihabitans fulvus]
MIPSSDELPTLLFAAGILALALVLLHQRPRAVATTWLLVICFVPWWTGLPSFTFLPFAVLVTFFALVCLLPTLPSRPTFMDWAALAFFAVCLLPTVVGGGSQAATFGVVAVWGPAFVLGRLTGERVDARWLYGCVGVILTVVAAFAVVEFITATNPFVSIRQFAGPTYGLWSELLQRGGRPRVEAAFGHPIALGSSLALGIPLVLASRFRLSARLGCALLMIIACVLTFSRTGILCAVIGLALSLLFMRGGLTAAARATVATVMIALALVIVPFATQTFETAGSEATRSSDYRGQLLGLIPDMSVVGTSASAQRSADGTLRFGRFASIDSQLILLGLTYGLLALLLAAGILTFVTGVVVSGRSRPATVAIAAQIPSLATVALITQYAVFFWFMVGFAVAAQATRDTPPRDADAVPSRDVRPQLARTPTMAHAGDLHSHVTIEATALLRPPPIPGVGRRRMG